MLVDKTQINEIFYCRDDVCAVTYIQKEYVCGEIMVKILKQPLFISAQRDPLSYFKLACTSIHETDDSISEDGADQQL